ncbi:helix-turn-helix domain-containing protein [Streptomyces sp. NPDC087263]|uniref:helix-turn-helix domain-containing protein n=1 Tax=Streptomyces sp. NPDC087263 TaxID=3365773 RepID=UPI0037F94320
MSRSAFSDAFRSSVGTIPAKYMLSLRMHSAKQILLKSDRTVSSMAAEFGYGSGAAFSTAFKRVMNIAPELPGQWNGRPIGRRSASNPRRGVSI